MNSAALADRIGHSAELHVQTHYNEQLLLENTISVLDDVVRKKMGAT